MPRVTITVPDRPPQPYRFQLDRRTVTLGRGSENDIPIECSSVSVRHAEMVRTDKGYEIRDLGSTNGTKLDEQRRMTIPLVNDRTVYLGDVSFHFQLSDEEMEAIGPQESEVVKEKPKESSMTGAGATGRSGVTLFLVFLVLAAGAFIAGMALHYSHDNPGRSWFSDLGKKPAPKTAPAPAPAATDVAPAADPTPAPTPAQTPTPAPAPTPEPEPGK